MSFVHRISARFRAMVLRDRTEREMHQEMAAHIEQATERFRARGMSERDARLAARKEFGQLGVVQEEARDARGGRWVDALRGDVRFALRQFARTPLTTMTIVFTLMLGIGANASLFAVIHAVTSRPAPGVPDDPSLAFIRTTARTPSGGTIHVRLPLSAVDSYRRLPIFSDVAGWTSREVIVSIGDGEADVGSSMAAFVTPNYFNLIGIRLHIGNGFIQKGFEDRDQPELTAILGHAFWIQKFNGNPDVVGRRFKVNGVEITVVGVAPPRFNGVSTSGVRQTLFLPLSAIRVVEGQVGASSAFSGVGMYSAVVRLRPEVSIADAIPAVKLIGARVASQRPRDNNYRDEAASLLPVSRGSEIDLSRSEFLAVAGGVALVAILVLLVCCTTVSSLLVGTAAARRQEIGVRLSLGASRARVIRQLLTEVTLLAFIGGACGLGLYALIVGKISSQLRDVDLSLDWVSAGVTAAVAVIAAFVCGLSPALHATRQDLALVLKDSAATATRRSRLQRTFVAAQIALTQPLLVGLAMMIAVLSESTDVEPGMRSGDRVLRVDFTTFVGTASREVKANMAERLVGRIKGLPGVAGLVTVEDWSSRFSEDISVVTVTGARVTAASQPFRAKLESTAPNYFEVLGIPIVRGRPFMANDGELAEKPIIIADDLAEELFGVAEPLGQRLREPGKRGTTNYVVVGVVATKDVGSSVDDRDGRRFRRIFVPPSTRGVGTMLVRTNDPAEPLIPTIRALAFTEAPQLPIRTIKTLAQIERDRLREMLQIAGMAAAGGLLALFLGAIGLYAAVSLGVRQRRREIGLRVALGAAPDRVVGMFFRSGVRLSLLGLAAGLPLSVAALWIFASQVGLPKINMPIIGLGVAIGVLAIASFATWLPARRAATVDPMVALRAD